MNTFYTILFTTVIIEIITLIGRFGLNISTKHIWIKSMHKLGLKHWFHFHHVFLGIIIMIIAYINYHPFYLSIGAGIALSDILHHTLLSIFVGNPEFHLLYKSDGKTHKSKLHAHIIHRVTQQNNLKE